MTVIVKDIASFRDFSNQLRGIANRDDSGQQIRQKTVV